MGFFNLAEARGCFSPFPCSELQRETPPHWMVPGPFSAAAQQSKPLLAELQDGGRLLEILLEEGPETSKVLSGCCGPPGSSQCAKINSALPY